MNALAAGKPLPEALQTRINEQSERFADTIAAKVAAIIIQKGQKDENSEP